MSYHARLDFDTQEYISWDSSIRRLIGHMFTNRIVD